MLDFFIPKSYKKNLTKKIFTKNEKFISNLMLDSVEE